MIPADPVWLGPEFDKFLYAPIGVDINGIPLSVVSALARLDVDPWHEAAQLTQLPRESAAKRLASLFAALPDGSPARLDPGTTAARLVALLPGMSAAGGPPRTPMPGRAGVMDSRAAKFAIAYVVFMAVLLGSQCTMASRPKTGTIDSTHASGTGYALPSAPLANPDN